jgi:hypothetical protein
MFQFDLGIANFFNIVGGQQTHSIKQSKVRHAQNSIAIQVRMVLAVTAC